MSRRRLDELLEVVNAIPPGARCAGVTDTDFIDVSLDEGALLTRRYCLDGCPVIAECRAVGDHLAPHRYPSVYGGRIYQRDEPADGWAAA